MDERSTPENMVVAALKAELREEVHGDGKYSFAVKVASPVPTAPKGREETAHLLHAKLVVEWLKRLRAQHAAKDGEGVDKQEAKQWGCEGQMKKANLFLTFFQVVLVILFATVAGSEVLDPSLAPGTGTQGYNMFIGVLIMMCIGFGYLMTFLKLYGLGALGITFVITAMGLQWSLFTQSLFQQAMAPSSSRWHPVDVNIYSLLDALYAVSAVLISFGALIGKLSPFQLVVMTVVELFLHSVNLEVLMGALHLTDMGGTYTDHMFGAYFGLAVSLMLGPPDVDPQLSNTSDLFSFVGTLFLWIYWPSFVAGAAGAGSDQQQRAIVNTVLSLSASTVVTYIVSSHLSRDKKLRPVDIQNATLAGGVAIGCTANLALSPFSAVMIGIVAGVVSAVGYHRVQPYLLGRIGLHDTCGVHNLHAMPSVVGGLASVVLAGYKETHGGHDAAIYGVAYPGAAWRQLVCIVVCVSYALVTGAVVGTLLHYLGREVVRRPGGHGSFVFHPFDDQLYWEVANDQGRSLYTELVNSIPDGVDEDVDAVKAHAKAVSQGYSSHHGRANIATSAHDTLSSHAARRRREIVSNAMKEVEAGGGAHVDGGTYASYVLGAGAGAGAAGAAGKMPRAALTVIAEHESEVDSSRV